MSRNILKKRLPASPNQPPHAPAKMRHKGQPVPLNVNLLIQGNNVPRIHSASASESKGYCSGFIHGAKMRPHSAHVDKHVLKSMSRSPSVDSSFYDRFERLDRDTIIGDTAYKEKNGRVRSGRKHRQLPRRPTSGKSRKRSKSASCVERTQPTSKSDACESFFEMAMSFDDETKQNTLSNAHRQISPRTLGIQTKNVNLTRRRPRSAKKSRERSVSSKRSTVSDVSSKSAGSASRCSSKENLDDKFHGKLKQRTSRSRTRKTSPKYSDKGRTTKKLSPDRKTVRSASYSGRKRTYVCDSESIRQKVFESRAIRMLPTPPSEPKDYGGDFAYHYTATGNRPERKTSALKRNETGNVAIDAVRKANEAKETEKEMRDIDLLFPGRPVSSKLPKLKMLVVPTAMPLASLVRSASAKMLMTNHFDSKQHY